MDLQKQIEWANTLRGSDEGKVYFAPKHKPNVKKSETTMPTRHGNVPVIVYEPNAKQEGKPNIFVNLHGGGFVAGNAQLDDCWCELLAEQVGCTIYNIEYSLAPEHKFPHAIEEIYDIALCLFEKANKIAIGGHSAGGNLATAVCLYNIEEGEKIPFVYQFLDYPVLDLYTNADKKPKYKEAIPVDMANNFNICYLNDPTQAKDPLASPVFAQNLGKMPQTLIITAELDSLAKEGYQYATRLMQAGVTVTYKEYKGMVHAFNYNGTDYDIALDSWRLITKGLVCAFG
ncbi:MAG: alpha/beta hydrolase [Defluviitaleaceae bacterium]|nr:alpha/beta hydrolase [Defluviitaleaceae bacterium]